MLRQVPEIVGVDREPGGHVRPRPKVNKMEVVGHGAFVEFNADELRQAFASPCVANRFGRRKARFVVRVDGDFTVVVVLRPANQVKMVFTHRVAMPFRRWARRTQ